MKYINEKDHIRQIPEGLEPIPLITKLQFQRLPGEQQDERRKKIADYNAALSSQPTFLKIGDGWEKYGIGDTVNGGEVEVGEGFPDPYIPETEQEYLEAAAEARRELPPSPVRVARLKHKEAGEESDKVKLYILSALDCLGHNDRDYAVGEGNIKDACIELEKALEIYSTLKP